MSDFTDLLARAREWDGRLPEGLALTQETVEDLDLSDLEFHGTAFRKCRFLRCDFSGAAFLGCRLEGCDLTGCRLPGSFWRDCRLTAAMADGADLAASASWTRSWAVLFRSVPSPGGAGPCNVKGINFHRFIHAELGFPRWFWNRADLPGRTVPHGPDRHGPDLLHPGRHRRPRRPCSRIRRPRTAYYEKRVQQMDKRASNCASCPLRWRDGTTVSPQAGGG